MTCQGFGPDVVSLARLRHYAGQELLPGVETIPLRNSDVRTGINLVQIGHVDCLWARIQRDDAFLPLLVSGVSPSYRPWAPSWLSLIIEPVLLVVIFSVSYRKVRSPCSTVIPLLAVVCAVRFRQKLSVTYVCGCVAQITEH